MLADVELAKAYRLLNHGPTVLVSSAAGGKRNVMAAAWAMPLDFDPPKVLVVVDKSTYSRELIEASGEFVLNIPCRAQAAQVVRVGSESGHELDKFAASGLEPLPARKVGAPLVAGCIGYLECKVVPEPRNQSQYDLFIGEVVAAQADDALFSAGHWHFDDDPARRSVHYIAGGAFFATGDAFSVA
ncbi:flavin reductase family protein [Chromobacterium subtsugae]|uniref:Flavin reductase family protein n=1 Tax=Chromobacterium subtsugae TaxID=251747 RepID=A0ABS7FD84_9NEIS|nr:MULTISPECIES: flavin reductase family protein [Chromobacterium]KUM03241.1 flavin reductase [Chromobacterium subtsugae]KZE85164.1 flavin reductase [Chromobacterium sp. F49]MBW7569067.1 flavin reductase family protein [Chromobacterium subtsugae]MBW8287410.1 flavin reductase family protein [Chromobacterium subtsugae]WSE93369.1 flavin reductase family protein [Chromobacterium subtsugae]